MKTGRKLFFILILSLCQGIQFAHAHSHPHAESPISAETAGYIKIAHPDLALYIQVTLVVLLLVLMGIFFYTYTLKKAVHKKTAELRSMTNALLQSNAELEKFAYITSHNLRAPVVNIISLLDLYVHTDDENARVISHLKHSAHRLYETLGDLTEIISNTPGQAELSEPLQLNKELKAVCAGINYQIVHSGLCIHTSFEAPEIVYSKKVLHSIFINLLTNAIKYKACDRKPEITIASVVQNGHTILSFSDNGIGIDLDKNGKRIFGLYQRFERSAEGKGMGLFIIKRQVETLGGKIHVESVPGKGTTFYIFIRSF